MIKSNQSKTLIRFLRYRSSQIGLALVLIYIVVALFAGVIAPYSPIEQHPKDRLQEPNANYWLGTDEFGRDILSRLMHGATNSLRIALISVTLACLLGSTLGMTAGYIGGVFDNATMRVMDLFFAFPAILLALTIVAALGPGAINTILAISVVYTPIFARVARGPVLSLKNMEFVQAAQAIGTGHPRILLRHILPNTVAPIIVQITLALSWAMLTEAGLSFLGLGTIPPAPSWGSMLSESRKMMEIAPWMAVFPGLAIMLGVLGFNMLGDGLRDALDPRLKN
ncbi:MAG: ABC transporter permease [Chloroflexi bacterium]|nr:ABC transporter permease [Chloroflexota bacterium]